jgi:hypothetical protein
MRRSSSWLVGAWVDVSDGALTPTWERIGMVTRHMQPLSGGGYVEPGDCTILLHGADERWFDALLGGASYGFRFTLPGLLLEWSGYAELVPLSMEEGMRFRTTFFGAPRVLCADERWAGLDAYRVAA